MSVMSLRAEAISHIRDFEATVWFSLLGLTLSIAVIASVGNGAMEFLALAG